MFWCKVTEKKNIFYVRHISLESSGFRGNKSTLRDWTYFTICCRISLSRLQSCVSFQQSGNISTIRQDSTWPFFLHVHSSFKSGTTI